MSIEDNLRAEAREMAARLDGEDAELERQQLELEKKAAEIEAKRNARRGSAQRLANYPVKIGIDYQCPRCWVERELPAPLRSVGPSEDGQDMMACRQCGGEYFV